jgi:hypothetical protein
MIRSVGITIAIVTADPSRRPLLRQAVESALHQTVPAELLVLGCGPDLDLSALYPVRHDYLDVDPGPYAAWRYAAQLAQTPLVHLLHDDDWLEPTFVERMGPALSDERVAYAVCDATIRGLPDGDRADVPWWGLAADSSVEAMEAQLLAGLNLSPCRVLYRRADLLRDIVASPLPMPFPPRYGHDLLLSLWPLLRYQRVAYVAEPLVNFRAHAGSITIDAMGDADRWQALADDYEKARAYYRAVKAAFWSGR